MGPTASGKTELALKISAQFPCEIISVDSVMIYRGMDIGAAKPSAEILHQRPHHLINILHPKEAYSAASFRADALRLIRQIHARDNIPLLVGGSMLYFSALQRGLSHMPGASPTVRKKLNHMGRQRGWEFMHARLGAIDPQAARRIHPNDPQRIQRALEVYELTGIPISEWHAQSRPLQLPFRALKIALLPENRRILHQRIEQRFNSMLKNGLLAEVKSLHQRQDLHAGLPAMRSVGYRQVWQYLDGTIDFDIMCQKAIIATRQLAKRQLTWLRHETHLASLIAERYDMRTVCHKIHSHLS